MTNQTIVVTDDDSAFLCLVKDVMNDEGYANVYCGGRDEGLDLIAREQPALILLDVHGGDVAHGWKTLSRIRSEPAAAHTPVIICTTDRRVAETRSEWLASQKCSVLEKPFSLDDLLRTVAAIIGRPMMAATMSESREFMPVLL